MSIDGGDVIAIVKRDFRRFGRYFFCLFLLSYSCLTQAALPEAALPDDEKVYRVGVSNYPPYGIIDEHQFRGISVEVWKLLNRHLQLRYQFVPVGADIFKNVEAVKNGEIDVLVGPVTADFKRARLVQFTRPYALNHVGMAYSLEDVSFIKVLSSVLERVFSYSLLIAVFFILLYAHLMWYFERQLWVPGAKGYIEGMQHIIWMVLLGKGAAPGIPTTTTGKFVHLVWISAGTVVLSMLYAVIISAFQFSLDKSRYSNIETDITQKRVVSLAGGVGGYYAKAAGYGVIYVNDYKTGMDMVLNKQADYFAGYSASIYYYIREQKLTKKLALANKVLKTSMLSFALPMGSPLVAKIDTELAFLEDNDLVTRVCEKYLDKMAGTDCF